MGLWFSVLIISTGVYSPNFLHTRLTIQKSMLSFVLLVKSSFVWFSRVLLASIKSMAKFLCPRCLVTKEQAQEMGTVNDMKRRIKKARVDTERWQSWIERVRRWIYEDGNMADGKAVNDVLNSESLSPTRVCWYSLLEEIPCWLAIRMHSCRLLFLPSISTRCLSLILYTRLNSEHGRHCLYIFYGYASFMEGMLYRN